MPIPLGILAVAGAGAAGGASDYVRLETTLISTNTASVTFSNLNNYATYKHLQIRAVLRGDFADVAGSAFVTLNSDTGNNYARHLLNGNGSSVSSSGQISTASMYNFNLLGANAGTNSFSPTILDILDFSSANKNTTLRSITGFVDSQFGVSIRSGFWNNTAAVTSINIAPAGGNFVAGSRISLYGIR